MQDAISVALDNTARTGRLIWSYIVHLYWPFYHTTWIINMHTLKHNSLLTHTNGMTAFPIQHRSNARRHHSGVCTITKSTTFLQVYEL